MKITILGSGGWEGIPAPFCGCKVCKLAISNPKSKDNRTRPEILVETNKGKFLIEISPDIRLQTARFNLPQIKDFFISHWHLDHMQGLSELHAWSNFAMRGDINLYCSNRTKNWIDANFAHIPKKIIVLKPFVPLYLFDVKITPTPLYHMIKEDDLLEENQLNNTLGFVLEHRGRKVTYFSDYYKVPEKSMNLIRGSEVAIIDGTFLFDNKIRDRLWRCIRTDKTHLHHEDIINFAESLDTKKVVFHSISELSEMPHKKLESMLPKNMHISYDGMRI